MNRAAHTVATLEVPRDAYEFIFMKLRAAGYEHAFMLTNKAFDRPAIDMSGIAIVAGLGDTQCKAYHETLQKAASLVGLLPGDDITVKLLPAIARLLELAQSSSTNVDLHPT